jgi:hypothetical protein
MAPSERGGDVDAGREPVCRSVVSSAQRRRRSSERRAIYSRCGLQATLTASLPPSAHRQKPPGASWARHGDAASARCLAARASDDAGAARRRECSPWHHGVLVCAMGRRRASWHGTQPSPPPSGRAVVVGRSCLGCTVDALFVCARRPGKQQQRHPSVCQVPSLAGRIPHHLSAAHGQRRRCADYS